jgi:putative restriction endonuclease
VSAATYSLPAWHRQALEWFEANAGITFAQRPFKVPGLQVNLSSNQMGIWKPRVSPYALSVVQTPKGIYADGDPMVYPEGTWEYFYHQQGKDEADLRDPQRLYANAALFKCWKDGIPVGVMIPGPKGSGYEVLGLAIVNGWNKGLFELVGPASVGAKSEWQAAEAPGRVSVALLGTPVGAFDPSALSDGRLKVIREVHQRQGGPRFRRALLRAYDSRCAMTRYDAVPALEAAHIIPYRGPQTNHVANGLLLRADIHDLFDLGLIAVDTDSMSLLLAGELAGTEYEQYVGAPLWMPREAEAQPNLEALAKHRESSQVA